MAENRGSHRPSHPHRTDVTVVMPVYNGEPFVREAVESVLAQTHRALHLVVVDDGSDDATPATLAGISDDRLEVLTLPHNQGRTAAVTAGLGRVDAPFVAVIGADDVVLPAWIAESLARLGEAPHADVVSCQYATMDEAGTLDGFTSSMPTSHEAIAVDLLLYPALSQGGSVGSSEIMRRIGYQAPFDVAEDYHLWADLLLGGCRFANLPAAHYLYRQHAHQSTRLERPEMTAAHHVVQQHLVDGLWPGEKVAARTAILPWVRSRHAALLPGAPAAPPTSISHCAPPASSSTTPCRCWIVTRSPRCGLR